MKPKQNEIEVVLAAHNGGCSTASGMLPVARQRVKTLDAPIVPLSAREMQVAA